MNQPARKLPPRQAPPVALHDRAMDNLQFIRDTMARSSAFTAISGGSMVVMGLIAIATAFLADATAPVTWIGTWLGTAILALTVSAAATIRKARRVDESVFKGPGRKFMLAMFPALAVGALLSVPFLRSGSIEFLPGVWLLLYGTAVLGGGAFSVRTIPLMGASFLTLGSAAVLIPAGSANLWMALGFGGLHIVFGSWIAWRHGG